MSHNVHKIVLRAKIPGISTMAGLLEYMRPRLGEPSEMEDWDDYLWFTYRPKDSDNVPYWDTVYDEGVFGMEYVIRYKDEYLGAHSFTIHDLSAMASEVANVLGVDPSTVKLHVVGWYNGVDEPISW